MERVEVRTQAELDRALAAGKLPICIGNGRFVLRGSSHAVLWDSSHAVLWDSSHAVLRGSSHAVLRAAAQAAAHDSAEIQAGPYNAVTDHGPETTIKGGVIIVPPVVDTAELWCEWNGVDVVDGVATLFKAVDDEFRSSNHTPAGDRIAYTPGSAPAAPDWDDGKKECGGGLHFSPSPAGAKGFNLDATRYVACPVALVDIAVHHPALYPDKVKARAVAEPGCYEVDLYGRRVEPAESVPA